MAYELVAFSFFPGSYSGFSANLYVDTATNGTVNWQIRVMRDSGSLLPFNNFTDATNGPRANYTIGSSSQTGAAWTYDFRTAGGSGNNPVSKTIFSGSFTTTASTYSYSITMNGKTPLGFAPTFSGSGNTNYVPPATTYTATYNGNGNTGGSTANSTYTNPPSTSGTIASNGFTRTGYYFTGWNTASNGSGTSYSPGGSFTGNVGPLYAQWSLNYYDISYSYDNGSISGSGTTSNSTAYYSTTSLATRANGFTVPTGYTFGGWSTTKDNTADYQPGTGPTFNLDSNSYSVTYYAVWNLASYTLSYDANSGTVSPLSKTVSYGSQYGTLPAPPDVQRTGYSFNGWFTASSGGSPVSSSTIMGSSNTTIYAQWTAAIPAFSDQEITTTATLNKNVNTNIDNKVAASPVTSYVIIHSGNGLDPTSWLSIAKESGTNNGILSGKPTQIGTYTFVVRASNQGGGDKDSSLITLIVYPAGKRLDSSNMTRLTLAKRFDGSSWVDLKIMKRFDGSGWQDIGNI